MSKKEVSKGIKKEKQNHLKNFKVGLLSKKEVSKGIKKDKNKLSERCRLAPDIIKE